MSNVSYSSNPSEHSIVACSSVIPLIGVGQTGCVGGTYFPSSGLMDPARSSKSTTFSDDPVSARLCRCPEAPQTKLVSRTRTPLAHPAAPHVMLMKGDWSSPWSRPTHSQDGRMKVSLTQWGGFLVDSWKKLSLKGTLYKAYTTNQWWWWWWSWSWQGC